MVDLNRLIPCTICPCMMRLTRSQYGYYYICLCGLTHGCHQSTGIPLGQPADKETRQLRIRVHELFKKWYQGLGIKRRVAYQKLALMMNLQRSETHIGMFNRRQCENLIKYFGYRLNEDRNKISYTNI